MARSSSLFRCAPALCPLSFEGVPLHCALPLAFTLASPCRAPPPPQPCRRGRWPCAAWAGAPPQTRSARWTPWPPRTLQEAGGRCKGGEGGRGGHRERGGGVGRESRVLVKKLSYSRPLIALVDPARTHSVATLGTLPPAFASHRRQRATVTTMGRNR